VVGNGNWDVVAEIEVDGDKGHGEAPFLNEKQNGERFGEKFLLC